MFTLLSFQVTHKQNELYNCTFANDESHKRKLPLTSLLIGENGSGKSYLLSQIADFFRFIKKIQNQEKKTNYKYEDVSIEYLIDSDLYFIKKKSNKIDFYINKSVTDISTVKLPSKIVAMSFMVNDKFSFARFDEDDFYAYRGVRATSNASYTSTIKRMIINALTLSISDKEKLEIIKNTLQFLGMSKTLAISYNLNRKTLFKKQLTSNAIVKKINELLRRKQYINETELQSIQNNPEEIINDINKISKKMNELNGIIFLRLELDNTNSIVHSSLLQSLLRLEKLEFISNPDVKFYKKDDFSFEETSSGEKNIIFTIFNLIANIKKNSLILIDEPELSLHPTWQMKYINFIKKSIKSYSDCHLLFASHSHFMISDLEPESSSIMSITQSDGQRICDHIGHSTYAWSVENILYKVFHLRTNRNAQVEMDLYELLGLISKNSNNKKRIIELVSNLEKIILDDNDPLKIIINQSHIYIEN